jgi:multidrug transporter EmrE-like cation transporter
MTYIYFAAAIISEVVATSALKASEQFTTSILHEIEKNN